MHEVVQELFKLRATPPAVPGANVESIGSVEDDDEPEGELSIKSYSNFIRLKRMERDEGGNKIPCF